MYHYTYLLINFLTVIICFIFSFDSRIRFNRYFSSFIKSSSIVAIPFILWDIWFTHKGVWWFDEQYTIGLKLMHLPIEEWLFFICIPFSCVFTYYCLNKFFDFSWANAFNNIIVFVSIIVAAVIGLIHYENLYTLITAITLILTLSYLHFVVKVNWIGQASLIFFILMLGFFPVNGVLTGTGIPSAIVNYNSSEFLNIRILTIPMEDAVYGYAQFLLNVYFFMLFSNADKDFKKKIAHK